MSEFRSRLPRACLHQQSIRRNRQISDALPCWLEDGIRDRRCGAVIPIPPMPFAPIGLMCASFWSTQSASICPISAFTGRVFRRLPFPERPSRRGAPEQAVGWRRLGWLCEARQLSGVQMRHHCRHTEASFRRGHIDRCDPALRDCAGYHHAPQGLRNLMFVGVGGASCQFQTAVNAVLG